MQPEVISPQQTQLQHCLTIDTMTPEMIRALMQHAETMRHQTTLPKSLTGKTVATLFFEPSTRTRLSFTLAARRLGAEVVDLDLATASTLKGESLLDTVRTLQSLACDAVVVRHLEEEVPKFIVDNVPNIAVLNAGDGQHAHPTQALGDLLTVAEVHQDPRPLSFAIVGDVMHSRVARSHIALLRKLGVKDIRLVSPADFFPEQYDVSDCAFFEDLHEGLADVDVILVLRIQKERLEADFIIDEEEYYNQYGVTTEVLSVAKPNVMVLHPGPMNRGIEIASEVADGMNSYISRQVENGLLARMALLEAVLGA